MEISLIGEKHRLALLGKAFTLGQKTKQIRGNQPYSLDYLLDRNKDLNGNGEVIEVDWNESISYHVKKASVKNEKSNEQDFRNQVTSIFKDEIMREKVNVGIPTNESYLNLKRIDALKKGQKRDYIEWLEVTLNKLNELKSSKTSNVKDDSKLDALKSEYESLAGDGKKAHHLWKADRLIEEIAKLK